MLKEGAVICGDRPLLHARQYPGNYSETSLSGH